MEATGVLENRTSLRHGEPALEPSLKTSLIAGVKTNVVIAVGVDGRLASDGPRFVPLLNAIDKDFKAPSKSVQTYHSGDLREKSYTTQSRMLNGFPESLTKMPYP
jgi:hypothetical protein